MEASHSHAFALGMQVAATWVVPSPLPTAQTLSTGAVQVVAAKEQPQVAISELYSVHDLLSVSCSVAEQLEPLESMHPQYAESAAKFRSTRRVPALTKHVNPGELGSEQGITANNLMLAANEATVRKQPVLMDSAHGLHFSRYPYPASELGDRSDGFPLWIAAIQGSAFSLS